MRIALTIVLAALLAAAAVACGGSDDLILSTTTSTQDTGLLDVLVPAFEKESGYHVKTIAVGSGQALKLGEQGEADVILAHSPAAEEKFVANGDGIERQVVMHNDFVIVGPPDDPAGIKSAATAVAAFKRISASGSLFVSRGDQSGTNAKELDLWTKAGGAPAGAQYQETGQGMGATLQVASEKDGYTLSDRGTYLAQKQNLSLALLSEGDPLLYNIYHVMIVNPDKHGDVNADGARAFARFITSPAGQDIVRTFGQDKYGQPLFVPDAFVQSPSSPATTP